MRSICFAVVALLTACASKPEAATAGEKDPCSDFELDVERVWSAGIKAEILGHGGELQASERKAVVTKLDQLSDDWVRLRTATCRDHFHRKLIDADTYRQRVKCFDDRLDEQRKIVAIAKGNDTAGAAKLADGMAGSTNACK